MKKQQAGFAQMYVLIAVAAVIAVLVFGLRYLYQDNKDLTKDNAKKDVVVEIQKDGIEKDAKSDKVTEAVTTDVQVKKDTLDVKGEKVAKDTGAKVEAINKEAARAAAAAKDAAEKTAIETTRINSVSAARIDGLWDTYCLAVPTDANCTPAPAKKATAEELEKPSYEATRLYVTTVLLGHLNPPPDLTAEPRP
jgi:hypothetical protein